jgi:predicted HTH transcriptional regulator
VIAWDMVQNQQAKHLRQSVIKTIAAFLNSEGGTLLIGVDDDKVVLGLDQDLKLLGGSLDHFGQLLNSLVADNIGARYARLIRLHAEGVNGKQVCVVDVDKAPEPAFVDGPRGKEVLRTVWQHHSSPRSGGDRALHRRQLGLTICWPTR